MAIYRSVREAGVRLCERAGYEVQVHDGAEAPAVAAPTGTAAGLVDDARPIAIEPLSADTIGPEAVVPRLASAVDTGRDCLFVVPAPDGGDALARLVATVCQQPTALAADDPEGRRFYSGPDRVPLSDGTFACVRAPRERIQWREHRSGDAYRLALTVGDEVAAVLEDVGALACPDPDAFRHSYARVTGGSFEVYERGETVAAFGGVAAMRRAGYTPVPAPLVPEHLLPADPDHSPARAWGVCTVEDPGTVYGPDGVHEWP